MHLVFIKFIEVFTRAGLVVGVTYSLALDDAGRFGITVTLIGLFAFAFNWERHIDIQRRCAGHDVAALDRMILDAIPFWAFNQLLMLPVFAVLAAVMAKLTLLQLLLVLLIVSGEHIANQTYQIALIASRYWSFVIIVAVKNVAVLLVVLPRILLAPSQLTLTFVLTTWAVGQTLCVIVIAAVWITRSRPSPSTRVGFMRHILTQHRASLTHFQIGIVAILSLQFDRLAIASLVPLSAAGTYFRHVLIVSFVYQFFNVASYNRILPRIFAAARTEPIPALWRPIRREFAMVVGVVLTGLVCALIADAVTGGRISARYHLSLTLALPLLVGALLRVLADFTGLLCNARHREALVLRNQFVAFVAGATALVVLTLKFGITGTAFASIVSSGIYLVLITRAVRSLAPSPLFADVGAPHAGTRS
ncbi:hypothetical protein [Sphingomonas sp. 37zxx]|uniref:hypothetical protein n=1 Tax=Sphingomonas sp. 37zxx TaxID=1550073 RepID=UPI00053BECB5|nr:hypothetical protein [Sphingomonas sp. 37zxx]